MGRSSNPPNECLLHDLLLAVGVNSNQLGPKIAQEMGMANSAYYYLRNKDEQSWRVRDFKEIAEFLGKKVVLEITSDTVDITIKNI